MILEYPATPMNDFTSGTQFDFTYAPGTLQEQILGFEMAGEIWSSLLADDVTVRIHVESTSDLPDEVIGAALPGKKKKSKYTEVGSALLNDIENNYYNNNIESQNDITAFNNLPSYDDEFSIIIDGQKLDKTKDFRLTNANAKSLGLLDDKGKLDGYILVNDLSGNSSVGWDYDALRSGGASGNDMDFLSVAMHEIGHILGFVSGIDDNDWLSVLTESIAEEEEIEGKDFKFASILDLYRYSDSSPEPGEIDLSVGGNPYFSIDGGTTNLGNFANGQYAQLGGDGYQASHWEQDSNQGIMNPILSLGQRRDISDLDLTAFDVIGWDINTAAAPSWDELYDNAVANVETANIKDRDKDIEKLIRESGYDLGRRSRRSSRASSKNFSFQLGGFWQFTTVDAVDTPEAIEAVVEDAPIVETEPEVVVKPNNISQIETEPEVVVSNNDTITANAPVVETEPSTTVNSNDENIDETEVEIIDNSNLEFVDNDAISIDEPIIESESEIVVDDNTEVVPSVTVEPEVVDETQSSIQSVDISTLSVNEPTIIDPVVQQEIDLAEVNNIENLADDFSAIDSSQMLVNTNLNEELVVSENVQVDNNATESAAVEADPSVTDLSNNYNESEETQNVYWYVPGYGYYLAPQSITGVSSSEQDLLFYANNG